MKVKKKMKNKILFFHRIRFKLTLAFLVPVVFIIVLGYASFNKALVGIVGNYEESVNQTMRMMNEYLTLVFDTAQTNYKGHVDNDQLRQYLRGLFDKDTTKLYTFSKEYTTNLHEAVALDAMLSNINVLTDTQECIGTGRFSGDKIFSAYISTPQGTMVNESQYTFFLFGNQSEIDEKIGTDSSRYAVRLARYINNAAAVLLVDISADYVQPILASLDGGENSYTGLITCDGTEFINAVSGEAPAKLFTETDFYAEAVASEETEGSQYVEYQGEEYLFLYSKLGGRGATICSLIPQKNIIARVADIKEITIWLVVAAAMIAIAMGSIIAGRYSKSINGIVRKLQRVGEGDLTVQTNIKGHDEFKLLADGIMEMVTSMKSLITSVTEASLELTEAAEWVSKSSNTFVETSDGIKNAVAEIETGTSRLDVDSAECLREMDALSERIGFVSQNAANISSLTNETGNVISSGLSSMDALTESAASTTQITGQVIDAIQELEEKSKSIGQIIKTINDIAEETNLLSLNASIEAARAGEAGRGFAVVAEEIKKLADESMESSAEIQRIVEEIIKGTGQVVTVAKHAEDTVKMQSDAVDNTTGSFSAIDEKVASLMESLTQIEHDVKNMESARENTLSAITNISAVSAEAASGSATVYTAAGKQMDTVLELEEAAGKLSSKAEELTELLQKFKI